MPPIAMLPDYFGNYGVDALRPRVQSTLFAIIDVRSRPDHPLGDAVETFTRREDAERFIEQVRGDDAGLASNLRIEERGREERGLEACGLN